MITAKLTNRNRLQIKYKFNMTLNDVMKKIGAKYSAKYDAWTVKADIPVIEWLLYESGAIVPENDLERIFALIDRLHHEHGVRQLRAELSNMPALEPIESLQQICKKKVRPCQWVPVHYADTFGLNFLLADDMRCVDGDALVSLNRCGRGFKTTLAELYRKFHGGINNKRSWDLSEPTFIRSLCDGVYRLNQIKDVVYSGKKPTLLISLESGKQLAVTADHEICIDTIGTQFKRADQLAIGDLVTTNGTAACIDCGSSENVVTYKNAKFVGYCKNCVYRKYRFNAKKKTGRIRGRYLTENEIVHHRNHIRDDNRLENLELTNKSDHASHHGSENGFIHLHGGRGRVMYVPKRDAVVSIVDGGERDVYDVVCTDPYRNFVANGIVVHNCGKTLASLLVTKLPQNIDKKVLITCPASVIGNWQNEILESFGEPSIVLRKRAALENDPIENVQVIDPNVRYYITSYRGMQKQDDLDWLFIFDESHKIKNGRSQQSKYATELTKNSRSILLLTGTPVQNRPKEVYPQLYLIRPKIQNRKGEWVTDTDRFINKSEFERRYCGGSWSTESDYQSYGQGSSDESGLHQFLKENGMLRRLKRQVFDQLPERTRETIYLSNKKLPVCESVLETFSKCSLIKSTDSNFLSWVEDCLDQNEKVLLFCVFKPMMQSMMNLCESLGYRYLVINGDVSIDKRTERIKQFKDDPSIKAFILSIVSASDGINLSAADVSVFCDQYWNPEVIHQAENRTFSDLKPQGDISYFPIAFDYEYDIQKMLLDKLVITQQIHDGLSVKDFDSKRSLVQSIALKYGIKTGFELRKEKNLLAL